MDGIVITHDDPRIHVWTFVAALNEDFGHQSGCHCSNVDNPPAITIPPFVGTDYFCDSGTRDIADFQFFPSDPLWDGAGCGPTSSCCLFNNPPWFFRALPSLTGDDLEMRVCRDAAKSDFTTGFNM